MPSTPNRLKPPENELSPPGDWKTKEQFRIVVMGAAGVGKTCLVSQFMYDRFLSEYKPTVEDLHRAEYHINGNRLTLDILDTAGAYEFPAMRKLSITNGDAFVLVYAIDDERSFVEVENIRQEIIQQKGDILTPIVIVGNKMDKSDERRVHREATETLVCIEWGNGHVETSAKENKNVVAVFKELLRHAKIQYALSPAVRRRREGLGLHDSRKAKKVH